MFNTTGIEYAQNVAVAPGGRLMPVPLDMRDGEVGYWATDGQFWWKKRKLRDKYVKNMAEPYKVVTFHKVI